MAIELFLIDGMHCPRVVCDACHELIEEAADGITLFKSAEMLQTNQARVIFVHRDCDRHRDHDWQGLDETLRFLSHNMRVV